MGADLCIKCSKFLRRVSKQPIHSYNYQYCLHIKMILFFFVMFMRAQRCARNSPTNITPHENKIKQNQLQLRIHLETHKFEHIFRDTLLQM